MPEPVMIPRPIKIKPGNLYELNGGVIFKVSRQDVSNKDYWWMRCAIPGRVPGYGTINENADGRWKVNGEVFSGNPDLRFIREISP